MRRLVVAPRVVDSVVVVLSTWLLLGAYIVAYAYVYKPEIVLEPAYSIGTVIVNAAFSLLTLYLFAGFAIGLSAGRKWNEALPEGQTGSFAALLIFAAAWIVDNAFWSRAFGAGGFGLEQLFTPPHLIEIAAGAVVVSGPLRAAARRGEAVASPVTLASTALLLSSLTFVTQFMHPLIDPTAAANYEFRSQVPRWVGENIGVASVLSQGVLLAGTGLLLNSGFKLRPGSMTFVFTFNGLLVTTTKLHYQLLPVAIVTGLVADGWIAWTSRRPGRPSASLTSVIGGAFALAYLTEVTLLDGTSWPTSLWIGTVLATTMVTWFMGRLLRAGLPAAVVGPHRIEVLQPAPENWTLDPSNEAREQLVRAALDDLGTPEALGRSPLARLPAVSKGGTAASELRALLVDMIGELAGSASPRDAEAGHLLLDYYVKRVGSHEVIMERLHMSRPTYYRRLHHGFELVAERLDQLSVAERV